MNNTFLLDLFFLINHKETGIPVVQNNLSGKVIIQSILRLLTTQEGEIPNYRSYGLNLKQFSQYPLTKETASYISKYIENKVITYEQRVTVQKFILEPDFEKNAINIQMVVRIKSTGELVQIPMFSVGVAS